jgi:hypothetical protein
MELVNRLLAGLGGKDAAGRPTLDHAKVEIKDGSIIYPWRIGSYRNRVAEQLTVRLQQETGCVLADSEHSRIVDAAQFAEAETAAGRRGKSCPGDRTRTGFSGVSLCAPDSVKPQLT